MPSSRKTKFLNLNLWNGEDKPKRTDWNSDNEKIDAELFSIAEESSNHQTNGSLHVTANEKTKWNTSKSMNSLTYTGNGESIRTINLGVKPSFLIVFAINKATLTTGSYYKCYSAFGSTQGCSLGLSITTTGFSVRNSNPDPNNYVLALNESNLTYICMYQ